MRVGVYPAREPTLQRFAATIVTACLVVAACSPSANTDACDPDPSQSVARLWNEATLEAIRNDLPAPTVHSRNLFHVSAAMFDAWAIYDDDAVGVFVDDKYHAADIDAARREAISYAAYRVLEARYLDSIGATETIPAIDALMEDLCYSADVTGDEGDDPAAIGNRIARVILDASRDDGSNESDGYDADYEPVNPPLVVREPGTVMVDPNRWQPLEIENMVSQNGILLDSGVQEFIGPHWGFVDGFAIPPESGVGLPIDPGPPPYLGDPNSHEQFKEDAVDVIAYSSMLDPTGGQMVDISPASLGNNPLGTNDGAGRPENPATGSPYEAVVTNVADFGRGIAEFWADGPNSETPPGHWNTLANSVSDSLGDDLRIRGQGDPVDRLEWDVKLYLALNGANHDAAIAAWGAKGFYDYVRPISMIRWMGGLGQSTDPELPSYNPDGLPLREGLVELITEESSAPGGRHSHLADHVGEIAILAYRGGAGGRDEIAGVDWIRAIEWVPYQSPTFVTPSFAGYVSGHSAFSRASAEVLTAFTGSEYFPGGLGEWVIAAGSFDFDKGPESPVRLQWATYRDASDQAGISRLYGGIHVGADDVNGRIMGAKVGRAAWELAEMHFGR